MKLKLTVFATLFLTTAAQALPIRGPSSGGGGFAVVCPATPLTQAKVELLDLYEAKSLPGFVLAKASGSISDDYLASVQRTYTVQGRPDWAQSLRPDILENLNNFFLSSKFVASPDDLPSADDLGAIPQIPSSCSIQQVAFFDDTLEKIYILKDLFDKMDSLSQAALVQHELWYRDLRGLRDTTSQLARLAVGHVFAVRGLIPLQDGVNGNNHEYDASNMVIRDSDASGSSSSNEVSNFFIVPLDNGMMRLQFTAIQGRAQLTKTYIDVPAANWDLKMTRVTSDPSILALVVQTPNQFTQIDSPIEGSMAKGLRIRYTYQTGERITLVLMKDGVVLSEAYVDTVLK